jgi:hypothetical protein
MPVNEPAREQPPTAHAEAAVPARRRRRWGWWLLVVIGSVAAIVALVWFVALPWVLRNRVQSVLQNAGVSGVEFHVASATPWGSVLTRIQAGQGNALGINRIVLDYTPSDLIDGRVHAIHIRGGRLDLHVHDGRVDLSPLTAMIFQRRGSIKPAPATQPSLPVDEVDLMDCQVVFRTDRQTIHVPVDIAVQNESADKMLVAAHVGPAKNLLLNGVVDLSGASATFAGTAQPGWTLVTVRSIWPKAQVGVGGVMKFTGSADWGGGSPGGELTLRIAPDESVGAASQPASQLRISKGVLKCVVQLGASPNATIDLQGIAMTMPERFMTSGVDGQVRLSGFSPLKSPPAQLIQASSLSIGGLDLKQGMVQFQLLDSDRIHIGQTKWNAFGGSVWAEDFTIVSGATIKLTLHAQDIELKDLLSTFAKGKAAGQGRITGELPVTVAGSDVQFGDGKFSSSQGGQVRIEDAGTLSAIASGAAESANSQSQKEQLQHNIVQALSDFEYNKLSATLDSKPGGELDASVHLSGHGRTGAKQGLDYQLNIHRLDLALKSYLSISGAMSGPENAAEKATTKAASP